MFNVMNVSSLFLFNYISSHKKHACKTHEDEIKQQLKEI